MGSFDNNFMLHGINEYEPSITTFDEVYPNNPTNKTGHYSYVNAFREHETTFLNCANNISGLQEGEGGFQFHSVNSTQSDLELAKITRNGLTINRSTGGVPQVYSPNVQSLAPDGKNIFMDSSINLPPFNFNSQTFNPVYMTQTTSYYTAGDLCYAVAGSDFVVQIFNNNNTTNPIPPNVVPSDFGNNTNVGIITGIPLFTLNPPSPPSVPQIANLNEVLTITTDTKSSILSSTSLRNNTNKTILDLENNQITLTDSVGTTQTNIYSNSYIINNEPEGVSLGFTNNAIFIATPASNTRTNIYAGQQQNSDLLLGNQSLLTTTYLDINKINTIEKSLLTFENLSITDVSNNVSILSSTDLTFNGISVIAQEVSNTKSISKLQYAHPINIANSPAITGTLPSSPPMVPTQNAINTGFNGWYYKNISSAYNNISWANGFQPSSYVVSNLKGFYFTFVSLTTTSKPFVSIYTLPAQAPGGFYNSRRSYVPAIAPATITAGIPYIYYFMFDNAYPTPFKYCHTAVPLTLSATNPVGAFGPNELLYFMSINTNTISPANTEELIISESGVIIDDGTGTLIQPFSFNSADVYSPNSYKTVLQGAGTLTPTISNNGTTYVATANFTISNTGLSGVPAGFFIIVQGNNVDRTVTYNGTSTKVIHTNSGSTNAGQVNFYWTGTQFVPYN